MNRLERKTIFKVLHPVNVYLNIYIEKFLTKPDPTYLDFHVKINKSHL
jgi:hypothetical protein